MKTIEIHSVSDFHDAVSKTSSYHPIFRGEDKDNYALRSKYGRFSSANPTNNIRMEKATLSEFSRRSTSYLEAEPKNEWEMLSIAQHHGLATRLLDWTKNPLVAAYFATREFRANSVIYVMDEYELKHSDCTGSPFEIEQDLIYRPRHTAIRIASQAGLFTVHKSPEEIFSPDSLERWLLSDKMLIQLRTMLNVYGIKTSHIFPGLDSICQEIHESHIRLAKR